MPLTRPEDVISHLAKGEAHWRDEYSAKELALAWSKAGNEFPSAVQNLFNASVEYKDAEFIDGFFEREVDLGTAGRNSQTDLMVVIGIGKKLGIVAVEVKVDEPFGELVATWNDNSDGKILRLKTLCSTLGLYPDKVGDLRYQLLHRTASAIYEAKRYRSDHALMLVHSFSPTKKSFSDFSDFAKAMGIGLTDTGLISSSKVCEGVNISLAWVADRFASRTYQ